MPRNRGNARENAVARLLRDEGWIVGSMRHSEGGGDLIASRRLYGRLRGLADRGQVDRRRAVGALRPARPRAAPRLRQGGRGERLAGLVAP